ncbi:glycosyltransferase family 4 protein [Pontibacter vulgaris]|uniref:glycosyltransferase family 4 protein n=1 Tax=Pontibacter vulgaris TaxID=2905679 RepID=UPI001FA71380|nr:glycosyltransferase family 4 protein [Pontibacter vulgaris]
MKKVTIIQKALPKYRLEFYNKLRDKLYENNVELNLIYGKRNKRDALKGDEAELDWGICVPNKIFRIGSTELYWQPCLGHLKHSDLVIAEQANKLLINYLLSFQRLFTPRKFAFWGHGFNRQSDPAAVGNKFKSFYLNQCNWWFAYTNNVKQYLLQNAYPETNITCVQNAIDTQALSKAYADTSKAELDAIKKELNINSANVAIYCGGIYKEKRINFLIDACDLIRKQIPDFELIILGSGIDVALVQEAAKSRNWVHYLGPKFGLERVKYFKLASAFLMPGLVGLAVLDSFSLQTPMITTDFPFHSPEIEYLQHGINGLISENNLESYAATVIKVFKDNVLREKLVQGCQEAAANYTVDKMVANFSQGILQCLSQN